MIALANSSLEHDYQITTLKNIRVLGLFISKLSPPLAGGARVPLPLRDFTTGRSAT